MILRWSLFNDGLFIAVIQSLSGVTLRPHDLQHAGLPCPSLSPGWGFPGKNTGVGCHALLQGVFPTPGLDPHLFCLLHWQAGSSPPAHLGSPVIRYRLRIHLPRVTQPESDGPGIYAWSPSVCYPQNTFYENPSSLSSLGRGVF